MKPSVVDHITSAMGRLAGPGTHRLAEIYAACEPGWPFSDKAFRPMIRMTLQRYGAGSKWRNSHRPRFRNDHPGCWSLLPG